MKTILIEKIKPNLHQPRKYFEKNAQEILKETLKKQILPILVIPGTMPDIPGDIAIKEDEYLIIDGERRWRASKELKWKTMICEILDGSYTEAYDNAGIIHRTTATHDPQARAWLIVESILNHLGDELEKYGWSQDEKGVMSCALYLLHISTGRDNSKKVGKEFFSKFSEICKRHGWTAGSVSQRLPKDLQIPEDLLEAISDGTMAHNTATEFGRVKDKKIRKKIIERVKKKPMAFGEAQKTASILTDEKAPQEIKEKILDEKQDIDIDLEKEKVEAIKEVKKDEEFTDMEKQNIEKQIIREEFERPLNIVAKEKFKKMKKPKILDKISPDEFALSLSVQLGKMATNFKLLEPVWVYVSSSQKGKMQLRLNKLIEIWKRFNLIKQKEELVESKKK